MRKVLVTGGPVHAHLDAVKIVTNAFRGGRMLELAYDLSAYGLEVTYLGAKHILREQLGRLADELIDSPNTRHAPGPGDGPGVRFVSHGGFDTYRTKVLELAPAMDALVLGAAVANLIPKASWKGKFPSHDYKPGDVVDIPFIVAPRIIDEVRAIAPKSKLFGFKLLDGVDQAELERAAREVLRGARANLVIANDRQALDKKLVITPEGSSFWLEGALSDFLRERIRDEHYRTVLITSKRPSWRTGDSYHGLRAFRLLEHEHAQFVRDEDHLHGSIAVRMPEGTFVTHVRHKKTPREFTVVERVDHKDRIVHVMGSEKATLAAPLFDAIFQAYPKVTAIIHSHRHHNLRTRAYAPPGTAADTTNPPAASFRVPGHGTFWLLDENDKVL